eukprot:jgi/Chlat1/3690/Chrsp246S03834
MNSPDKVLTVASLFDARVEYLMRVVNGLRACLTRNESNELHQGEIVIQIGTCCALHAVSYAVTRVPPLLAMSDLLASRDKAYNSHPHHQHRTHHNQASLDTAADSCAATATERRYSEEDKEDSGSEGYPSQYCFCKTAPRRAPRSAPARTGIILDAGDDESAWTPWDEVRISATGLIKISCCGMTSLSSSCPCKERE